MEPRNNNIENQIINDFASYRENTLKSGLTRSAAMALRSLNLRYGGIINDKTVLNNKKTIEQALDALPANKEISNETQIIIKEAELLNNYKKCKLEIFAEAPEDKIEACEYLFASADEASTKLDEVTLFIDGKEETDDIPLKRVITLVWFALNDNKKYAHHLIEKDEALRKKEANNHRKARLDSFYRLLEDFKKNKTCHHGIRNDLIFLLNKSYLGMDLIEDERAIVLSFIRDKLTSELLACYENKDSDKQQLNKHFLHWIRNNDPQPLIEFLNLDLHKNLHDLFVKHGINPDKLNKWMKQAFPSVTFSCDILTHRGLYQLNHLFQVCKELHNETEANRVLKIAREFALEINDFNDENAINKLETFNLLFSACRELRQNKNLLIMTGSLNPEMIELEKIIQSYFSSVEKTLPDELISEKIVSLIEILKKTVRICKQDKIIDQIENFFFKYFDAIKSHDNKLLATQYGLLLNADFQFKLNKSIDILIQACQGIGEFHLGPYEVNLVFLYAISNPTGKWEPEFAALLQKTVDFVRSQFNHNQTRIASQLKKESYPDNLMQQMDYLFKKYRREANNPRPQNMLVLPGQVQTYEEWIAIAKLLEELDEKTFESVYFRYVVIIKRLLKTDAYNIEESLKSIPAAHRFSFLESMGEQIKETMETDYLLWNVLCLLPEKNRPDLINRMSDAVKEIVECGTIPSILKLLPEEYKPVFVELMSDKIKNIDDFEDVFRGDLPLKDLPLFIKKFKEIINDGNKLAKILKNKHEACREGMIDIVEDDIQDIIKNGDQLQKVLSRLQPVPGSEQSQRQAQGTQRRVLRALGNKIKEIIQDGDELAEVLAPLPGNLQQYVINQLKPNIKKIINRPEHLFKVSKQIKEDKDRISFAAMVKDKITNGNHIYDLLFHMSEENRLPFLKKIFGHEIHEKIDNEDQLNVILKLLPEKDRISFIKFLLLPEKVNVVCINYLKNNVREIMKNGNDLTEIFNFLSEKNSPSSLLVSLCSDLIRNLGNKLIDLMKNNNCDISNEHVKKLANYAYLIQKEIHEINAEKPSICFFGINPAKGDYPKGRRLEALNALYDCLLSYLPYSNPNPFDKLEEQHLEVLKDNIIHEQIYGPLCRDFKIGMNKPAAEKKEVNKNPDGWGLAAAYGRSLFNKDRNTTSSSSDSDNDRYTP